MEIAPEKLRLMPTIRGKKTMSDFKKQYKKPPTIFGNAKKIKVNLVNEQRAGRKKRRTHDFEENRKEDSLHDELEMKLLNWKAERRRKKEAQESQKKPPFVVGIVRHHVYFPVLTATTSVEPKERKKTIQANKNSNIKKRITKATEKRLLAKAASAEKRQKMLANSAKEKSTTETNVKIESDVNRRQSFAPLNHKFNPPAGLPNITLFNGQYIEHSSFDINHIFVSKLKEISVHEVLHCSSDSIEEITLQVSSDEQETLETSSRRMQTNSIKSILNVQTPLFGLSLHTFTAIEKENCSKNQQSSPTYLNDIENNIKENKRDNSGQASGSSNSIDKFPIKGALIENPGIPMEKKYTAEYFKRALNEEKSRLRKLCKEWTEIQSQDDITDDIRYQINQAVGQTTMLIEKKFKQFHGLILDCEKSDSNVVITSTDLHGFWDMMYIEVKDCDSRFAKLEKLRARCWREDQSSVITPGSNKKRLTKKKIIPAKRSLLPVTILSDKRKIVKIKDNKKHLSDINRMDDKCITPCVTNKRAASVPRRNFNVSRNKTFLELPTNYVYTSTPLPINVTSNASNRLNTPLIAMKVSKLYNKFTMLLNDSTLLNDIKTFITPERTSEKNSTEKSGRSRSKSLRMESARKIDLNDHLNVTKLSDGKLEIGQNLGTSSEKINKSDQLNLNERIRIESNSDLRSDSSEFVQTIIEKTVNNESCTLLSSSCNTDLTKSLEKTKTSVTESSLNKNLKMKSFEKRSRNLSVDQIVKSPFGTSITNISPISHAMLIHDVKNISSKMTPSVDQVPKKRNSSIKRVRNKTVISPKVSRQIKTMSPNKKYTD